MDDNDGEIIVVVVVEVMMMILINIITSGQEVAVILCRCLSLSETFLARRSEP